jgi:hypothetical protein
MKFEKILRGLAPVAALALAAGLAGCKDMNIRINDEEGVPLSELDTSGEAPTELVLAAPDTVVVTSGTALDIDVEGDQRAVDALRFTFSEGTLGILREKGEWNRGDAVATVRVTMPAPRKIVIAGSGGVAAQTMAREAEVTIAGSGRLDVASLAADQLDANIMGSGTFGVAGTATALDLTVAGSGSFEAKGLKVDRAELNIMGSGDAEFASDGTVEAKIMGSGDVTVTGSATCTVKAMGSGRVTCGNTVAPEAPVPPANPVPPEAPKAPEAP